MNKKANFITAVLFCAILSVFSILFVVVPDRSFSEQENRSLELFPQFNIERFFSGDFANDINVYFSDQFPFRDSFVKIKSSTELFLGMRENNGVLYDYHQLAVRDFNAYKSRLHIAEDTDRIYLDTVEAQLNLYNEFATECDVPVITVLPPRTIDVTDGIYSYDRPDGDAVFDLMETVLANQSGYIDSVSLLREHYQNGEYVIYRTDHHWTTLGAYYVYCEVMHRLGKENAIVSSEEFEIEQIEGFSGTTAGRGNFFFYEKDVLELWHLDDDMQYTVIADGKQLEGFYTRKYLELSDKYSVYLDGTHHTTYINKNGEKRDTLLVAKDSFANCLIPFLAREYDIVALDLHSNSNLSAAIEQYDASAVLVVYNTENIITTADLGNVK